MIKLEYETRMLAACRAYRAVAADRLRYSGLYYEVSGDFEKLRDETDGQNGWPGLSKTANPDLVVMPPGWAWWIAVRENGGRLVGCQINRLIVTHDFRYEVLSGRLWGNIVPATEIHDIKLNTGASALAGRIVFTAGLWIHPAFRRNFGLNGILPRLLRAHSMPHYWPVDFIVGLTRDVPGAWDWSREIAVKVAPFSTGYYPPRDGEIDTLILWNDILPVIRDLEHQIDTESGESEI